VQSALIGSKDVCVMHVLYANDLTLLANARGALQPCLAGLLSMHAPNTSPLTLQNQILST